MIRPMPNNGNIERAQAESEIVEALAPYIGPSMARSAVEAHGTRLRIEGESLSREQLSQLVERLVLGLRIFVGSRKSDEIALELLAAVGEQEPA